MNQGQELKSISGQDRVQRLERQQMSSVAYTPVADIMEREDSYVLNVEMPGVSDKNVDITLENDVLTILGQVNSTAQLNARLAHREYGIGDYRRVFTLSEGVDQSRIEATMKDGVLHLVLPKAESSKTRKIAVKAE